MAILSKACKPGNFESHNSQKISVMNIWGFLSNFVDCKSFLKSNSPDILALCETNLDDSTDSCNFSVRGNLPLIQKDSSTHMHSLTVYAKEGLPFARDLSLENSADSYLCFWLVLLRCGASAAASEICEWVQVGIDVYIPHRKYQVKPHSSPWFSAACAAAIVHRNHFFHLYQREKSSDSKVKFREASNRCKRVLEAAKLAYGNKKSPSLPRNMALGTFGKLPIVFSTMVNLLYLLYSTAWRCCLLHLIKQNC